MLQTLKPKNNVRHLIIMKPLLLYVAGKYSGEVDKNIATARAVAAEICKLGHYPLCPHLATAKMDEDTGIDDIQFWYDLTMTYLKKCDGIVLVPGWELSTGAKLELVEAINDEMPIYVYPNLPASLRDGTYTIFGFDNINPADYSYSVQQIERSTELGDLLGDWICSITHLKTGMKRSNYCTAEVMQEGVAKFAPQSELKTSVLDKVKGDNYYTDVSKLKTLEKLVENNALSAKIIDVLSYNQKAISDLQQTELKSEDLLEEIEIHTDKWGDEYVYLEDLQEKLSKAVIKTLQDNAKVGGL